MIERVQRSEIKNMMMTDLLFLLITGLVSLYPVTRLVKYRDRKKGERD
jgi:hypothetical protein